MPFVQRKLGFRHIVPAILVLVIGVAVSVFAARWIYSVERTEVQQAFAAEAQEDLNHIERMLEAHIDELAAVQALMETVGVVELRVFQKFVRPLMKRHAGAQAFEWVPRVRHEQRAVREAAMQSWGFPGFTFRERGPNGTMVTATNRREYFPVYYVEPLAGNEAAFGFDLASNPARREAISRSWQADEMAATAPIQLVQEEGTQAGVLIFAPVRAHRGSEILHLSATDAEAVEADQNPRDETLRGFVLAVFKVGSLVQSALAEGRQPGARPSHGVHVFDVTDETQPIVIFDDQLTASSDKADVAALLSGLQAGEHQLRERDLFGRSWLIVVTPVKPLSASSKIAWLLFAIGLLAAFASAIYVFALSSRNVVVARQVAIRTRELDRARHKAELARKRAEKADAAKSSFLATMSHELRTPLTGVIGYIDLLRNKVTDPETQQILGKLYRAAGAQRMIVNDVLDYSKISAGALDLEHVPFDLKELVDTAVTTHAATAREGVMVGSRLDPTVPRLLVGDPGRFLQILNNLISNAVKFTQKGAVTVHVGGDLDMSFGAGTQFNLELSVQDTGIGIPEDKQASLFQPFMQADAGIAREFGGSGLGLAIIKEIADCMGGSLSLESKPGLGSKFSLQVRLPVASSLGEGARRSATEEAGLKPTAQPLRILVAEDMGLIREMLAATLTEAGHMVLTVENGAELLETVCSPAAEVVDLILMDMHMPILSGVEAAARIRALQGPAGNLPIIGLSADAVQDNIAAYIGAGIDGYVTKPIDWEELERTMKDVVHKKTQERGANSFQQSPRSSNVDVLVVGKIFEDFSNHLSQDDYERILKTTTEFFEDSCSKLDVLMAQPDFGQLKEVAHAISGAASTVGALQAASAAREITLLEYPPDDVAERTATLARLMRQSFQEFDGRFKRPIH